MSEYDPDMSIDECVCVAETVLHRAKYAKLQRISAELVRASAFSDEVVDQLVLRLEARLFGHELETIDASHPTTWVDALKDRWQHRIPQWVLDRWPINYTTVTLTASEVFPHMVGSDDVSSVFLTYNQRPWKETP